MIDPRYLQIGTLSVLLGWGLFGLDFEVRPLNAIVIVGTTQLVQWAIDRRAGRSWDPRSAAITSLSLCLLLRTNLPLVAAFAAALAIGSKGFLRIGGKHVFNPANVGIMAAVWLTGEAWISPGQWGNGPLLALLFACLGITVVTRASRSDVTFAFLGTWSALLLLRSVWWLGEPVAIPLHRLQSGALLLFAFFMISDPKTTPDARPARIAYAVLVATAGFVWQYLWFQTNGPIVALVVASPFVPLLDRLAKAEKYRWDGREALTAA